MFRQATAIAVVRPTDAGSLTEGSVLLFRRPDESLYQPGYRTLLTDWVREQDAPTIEEIAGPSSPMAALAACSPSLLSAWRLLIAALGLWPVQGEQGTQGARHALQRRLLLGEDRALDHLAQLPPSAAWQPLWPLATHEGPAFTQAREATTVYALRLAPSMPPPTAEEGPWGQAEWLRIDNALAGWRAGTLTLSPLCAAALERLQGQMGSGGWPTDQGVSAGCHSAPTALAATVQVPGIECLPLKSPTLPPATHTNCYLLGTDQLVLVDPGTPEEGEQAELYAWIDARLAAGARLQAVWLTHHHADHLGAAAFVRRRYRVPVWAHANTAAALLGEVPIDDTLADEQILPLGPNKAWQALFTPGHAVGHLCFYSLEDHHLLSGDNVLGLGTSLVPPAPHGDLRDYLRSLERIEALPLGLLLPGHGPPATLPLRRIQATLGQRRAREERLLHILAGSLPLSAETLLAKLYRGITMARRPLAKLSLRAHVEKLARDGELELTEGPSGSWSARRLGQDR